ncbi:MAG: MFS transporter [Geminicoccaceae bacterium]|nr:MAG: MFS transporter [Geminicoccaceae bacterium]
MNVQSYALVTGAYWGQTLTDGALRMLVLLHFHTLGFTPFQIAFVFVLYEFMGVVTNLMAGWIAARFGLQSTLYAGLSLQVTALIALAFLQPDWPMTLAVAYAVVVQGAAGVAKDLTKMSAKSAVKLLAPSEKGGLFQWVAVLTGSKNAMKGVGFFVGGVLLATLGFQGGLFLLAAVLAAILTLTALTLPGGMGRAKAKKELTALLAKSRAINRLSAARVFLFGARDVWFVVGVPIFLYEVGGWSFVQVSTFLALWVIGYGVVQAAAPRFVESSTGGLESEVKAQRFWALVLATTPLLVALGLALVVPFDRLVTHGGEPLASAWIGPVIVLGLGLFGAVFAVNSSLHSYLILAYSRAEDVTMDVGFYYMANAAGRLVGCLLSGLAYQLGGVLGCLLVSTAFLVTAWTLALTLPTTREPEPAAA